MTLRLSSPAFAEGGTIPPHHTCDGTDVSPPLAWTGVPKGTKSLALVCDDPDAPAGTWVHWVVWNIPPDSPGLEENLPKAESLPSGLLQGLNDFRRVGYGGPCPPSGTHRYSFRLYALDASPALPPRATKASLEAAMQGRVLAEAELVGTYARKR